LHPPANDRKLQESAMLLAPPKLAIPEVAGEHVPISHAQDMGVTVLKPTLKSSAIPYQKN